MPQSWPEFRFVSSRERPLHQRDRIGEASFQLPCLLVHRRGGCCRCPMSSRTLQQEGEDSAPQMNRLSRTASAIISPRTPSSQGGGCGASCTDRRRIITDAWTVATLRPRSAQCGIFQYRGRCLARSSHRDARRRNGPSCLQWLLHRSCVREATRGPRLTDRPSNGKALDDTCL